MELPLTRTKMFPWFVWNLKHQAEYGWLLQKWSVSKAYVPSHSDTPKIQNYLLNQKKQCKEVSICMKLKKKKNYFLEILISVIFWKHEVKANKVSHRWVKTQHYLIACSYTCTNRLLFLIRTSKQPEYFHENIVEVNKQKALK